MIITVDGPAGSGKTTTAKEIAARLGYRHLDSGALYRALTYALLKAGIPESDWPELTTDDLSGLGVRAEASVGVVDLYLGDALLGEELRTPEVTRDVPAVAKLRAVRTWLLDIQRRHSHGFASPLP